MRLSGQEKMGYYPTPTSLLDAIASYLIPSCYVQRKSGMECNPPQLRKRVISE